MVGGLLALQVLLMPASAEPETAVEKAMKAKTVVGALGLLGVVNPVPGKLVLPSTEKTSVVLLTKICWP